MATEAIPEQSALDEKPVAKESPAVLILFGGGTVAATYGAWYYGASIGSCIIISLLGAILTVFLYSHYRMEELGMLSDANELCGELEREEHGMSEGLDGLGKIELGPRGFRLSDDFRVTLHQCAGVFEVFGVQFESSEIDAQCL